LYISVSASLASILQHCLQLNPFLYNRVILRSHTQSSPYCPLTTTTLTTIHEVPKWFDQTSKLSTRLLRLAFNMIMHVVLASRLGLLASRVASSTTVMNKLFSADVYHHQIATHNCMMKWTLCNSSYNFGSWFCSSC
jgi:hypothetical protein